MSANSKKGYAAEHLVEMFLREIAPECYRPRAGSKTDVGDIGGLPFVVSVKDHARMELATGIDEAHQMMRYAGKGFGVVWHKRRGRGHPRDWYVTMRGADFFVLAQLYIEEVQRVRRLSQREEVS